MWLSLGSLSAVLLGQQEAKSDSKCRQNCHFLQAGAQGYIAGGDMDGAAEMMEKPKWEERAEASSSPVAAGSSVLEVSILLLAVKLTGNIS